MSINLTQAELVLRAAVRRAQELGVPVHVAILDPGAHLKAFVRMDGAVLGSLDVALKKAKTAVLFEANSEAVWEYLKPGAPAHGLELSNGGLATFPGGIPIRSQAGELLGAIGVSGGSVPQDFEIASAGLAAYLEG